MTQEAMYRTTLILGLGNILLGDEGFGVHVARIGEQVAALGQVLDAVPVGVPAAVPHDLLGRQLDGREAEPVRLQDRGKRLSRPRVQERFTGVRVQLERDRPVRLQFELRGRRSRLYGFTWQRDAAVRG